MSSQIDHLLNETRRFAPSAEFAADARRDRRPVRARGGRPGGVLGRPGARACTGTSRSPRCSTGRTRRSRSGSPTASSTSPTTASTVTWRPATATASRCYWEGEPGDSRRVTYAELTEEVKRLANVLEGLGIGEGDRVAIYMPMIPEAIVAMLAVARLGAIHSVVFGGFRADSLRSRIDDAGAKLVITADGGYRKGKVFPLKPAVDVASPIATAPACRRPSSTCWSSAAAATTSSGPRAATSGGTTSCRRRRPSTRRRRSPPRTRCSSSTRRARPGSRRASCTPRAATSPRRRSRNKVVHDLHPETDVFWCTADIGWITGHSYVVYGPLANGATRCCTRARPTPAPRPLVGDHPEVQRDDPLHGAHRHPRRS